MRKKEYSTQRDQMPSKDHSKRWQRIQDYIVRKLGYTSDKNDVQDFLSHESSRNQEYWFSSGGEEASNVKTRSTLGNFKLAKDISSYGSEFRHLNEGALVGQFSDSDQFVHPPLKVGQKIFNQNIAKKINNRNKFSRQDYENQVAYGVRFIPDLSQPINAGEYKANIARISSQKGLISRYDRLHEAKKLLNPKKSFSNLECSQNDRDLLKELKTNPGGESYFASLNDSEGKPLPFNPSRQYLARLGSAVAEANWQEGKYNCQLFFNSDSMKEKGKSKSASYSTWGRLKEGATPVAIQVFDPDPKAVQDIFKAISRYCPDKPPVVIDLYGNIVDPFAKPINSKLEQLASSATAVVAFIGSLFFTTSTFTGNVIGTLSTNTTNLIGVILFLIGITGTYFYIKKSKS